MFTMGVVGGGPTLHLLRLLLPLDHLDHLDIPVTARVSAVQMRKKHQDQPRPHAIESPPAPLKFPFTWFRVPPAPSWRTILRP
ncbi:protein of unknown function [Thauera humireducens]|nr:protein of unknown function [Thauera humireducens]